ncbi:MAG: ABC transporter transmembrane domain-containing protein [Rhodospirillales bacterium]|jgi:ABC-type multidrug transport system fused ATPase/permease subunit/CRP-like cAMP-binding protein|nr:ABC transporter transmembrane domain-containing protein [Rhodospirillales bacterium]MDP6645745.1 ABC transporter transmembrane domain-containing protein [Rhodospirillales bacterium]MDP6840319.1 ABC transporter transmembrane domain-containing protein [Rhodospirillales bacterium]
MEKGIFQFVLRYSKKEQIYLLVMALASLPFYFFSLDLPKQIVDNAIKGKEKGITFPFNYYGLELEQVPFLLVLCFLFLLLVFINGGIKYFINVYRGAAGERMLRRLRYQLLQRIMRFPLPQFRKTSQGEVVSMVTLETEPLGGFFGDALSLPSYQGGLLLTLMVFMFVQDWKLGLAAIALYPIQGWLIPKFQRKVNALGKERVQAVRRLSERIGESVTGAGEIHANDTSQYELADFSDRLGKIYGIRFDIYKKKFFIKFLNNFLALMTPFFFYSIGGYLVIRGDMTVGSLIAVLGAYKDVSAPWKMLLTYYQRLEDARIKYGQLIEKFEISDLLDENKITADVEDDEPLTGQLTAANISYVEDDGLRVIDSTSMVIQLPSHFALLGPGGSGKGEFAQMTARLLNPSAGKITINDKDIAELPEAVTGRRISYTDQNPYIFGGTIQDNLLYGLKHRPLHDADYDEDGAAERENALKEAEESGNSIFDFNADWVDYSKSGADSSDDVTARAVHYLDAVGMEEDVYQIGLRRTIDPNQRAELAAAILQARGILRARLEEQKIADFVESFDKDKFNTNAAVAENILFGTPVGAQFEIDNLGENEYVLGVLENVGLTDEFLDKGQRLAEIMVDLFKGLPADHEFWERFSFIGSDDLPDFESILARISQGGLDVIADEDRSRLLALPFKLIPARHHIGLVEEDFQDRLLEARREFESGLSDELRQSVEFFDAEGYNAAASIQDNILFGKLASERAQSAERVGVVLAEVVGEVNLRNEIISLGLAYDVGIGGSRLSPAQRQKVALARSLIKQPDLMIVNEAMSSLDAESQAAITKRLREEQAGRSLMLLPSATEVDDDFDQVFNMASGKIAGGDGAEAVPDEARDADDAEGGFGEEIDVLASIPMFASLDRSRLKLLSFASERFSFDTGDEVFHQGDIGDAAFVIIDGEADVVLETNGGPKTLVTMGRNDIFGELALLCDAPRTATIRAATDLSVMSISKDIFFKLISEDQNVSAQLTRSVADRLERTTRDLSDATTVRDVVTNLPDGRLFADRMRYIIARKKRFEDGAGLLLFNVEKNFGLDGLLSVEDHNSLFRTIADRIVACARDTDMAARVDNASFAIIVAPIPDDDSPKLLAQRITNSLVTPIEVGEHKVQCQADCEFIYRPLEEGDPEDQLADLISGGGQQLSLKGTA